MNTDPMLLSELNYRSARIRAAVREARRANRVRRSRKPAERVA